MGPDSRVTNISHYTDLTDRSELTASREEHADSNQSSVVAEETSQTIPQSSSTPAEPLRPETIVALDMMKNILSGTIVSFSPMQQQQIITEIKAVPSFLTSCELTPQQVRPSCLSHSLHNLHAATITR